MTGAETTQFGKYRIETEIGRGGFGTVYRAIDTTLERPVALKILEPMLMRDHVWVSRFRREAKLMAKLDHANIVPIHEIADVDGHLFIAMKLITGGNLSEHLKENGSLALEDMSRILNQVAAALDFAYSLNVVHRDLKPANVLLDDQTALLTDFGFARLVGDNSQSVTVSGSIVGTPAYIAPEVWEEKSQGAAGDIYALGCILYEMATGEVLFQGESTPAIMLSHFRPPPLPGSFPADMPAHMLSVIKKALAREPSERYSTATEMAHALAETLPQEADRIEPIRQLKEQAVAALADGNLEAANSFVTSLTAITPNDLDLPHLRERLAQAKAVMEALSKPKPPVAEPKPEVVESLVPEPPPVERPPVIKPEPPKVEESPQQMEPESPPDYAKPDHLIQEEEPKKGFFQRLFTVRGCVTTIVLLLAACGALTICGLLLGPSMGY